MIYILGGRGFVGSAFARLFASKQVEYRVIDRDNYTELVGTRCDVLVNANGNSKKYLADRTPLWEFDASVRSVASALEDFKAQTVIHLSSGDVYPDQSLPQYTLEEVAPDLSRSSRYGLHKRLAEILVQNIAPRYLIMRMGGFVGPGLRKNAIFDLLNDAPVWISPESELQFVSTDAAAAMVWRLHELGVSNEIVNLGARGLAKIGDIASRLRSKSAFQPAAKTIRFELSVQKLSTLLGHEPPETTSEVDQFLSSLHR